MSKFVDVTKKCAICGYEHTYSVVMSTNAVGYMDLDTRPPMMRRSMLPYEIEFCQKCKYANRDISRSVSPKVKEYMQSAEYRSIADDKNIGDTAKAFLLSAYLNEQIGECRESGMLYLNTAWIFDDENDKEASVKARKKAINQLTAFVEKSEDIQLAVLIVDLYRRIGDFEEATLTARQLIEYGVDAFLEKILRFEIKLCNVNDDKCHNVGELD